MRVCTSSHIEAVPSYLAAVQAGQRSDPFGLLPSHKEQPTWAGRVLA